MTERKQYSREFKIEALQLWQTTDKSAREVEEELRISAGLLDVLGRVAWETATVSEIMTSIVRLTVVTP